MDTIKAWVKAHKNAATLIAVFAVIVLIGVLAGHGV